jgi:RNA polymerase sigma-70 factor (ECF subfamily)
MNLQSIDSIRIPVTDPASTRRNSVLAQVAAGEDRAMNRCISQYGGLVWSCVRRYVRDEAAAEDLVQEIFTEIWEKAPSFDPSVASETTFVGLIARRRAIDFLRRTGRQPEFEPLTAAESIPLPTRESCSVTVDPEVVQSSLASLPAETRRLFRLFFDDGFTHPEIAEQTGLPLGTVKTTLRRGLVALRARLQGGKTSTTQSA